jgi:hypothetical protein
MKVTFGNYTYFDADNEDKNSYSYDGSNDKRGFNQFIFDANKFNSLIANRQYEDAANYAAMYHFNDPATQRAHESDIANLRREGRVLGAIYSRIDKDKIPQIEFYDKVFVDGGLETLSNNQYAKAFAEYKKQLGSDVEHNIFSSNKTKREATKLSVTFAPETQKLLGIDWLMPDNDNNIDNFYKTSGLNEQALKAQGVEIITKDGYTTLRFDKSNALANKIILNLPEINSDTFPFSANQDVGVTGLDNKNNIVGHDSSTILALKSLVNNAYSEKDKYFQQVNMTTKDYSSTIGPAIDDNLEALQAAYASGQIDETTFNKERKLQAGYIEQAIKSMGSGNYEMYTNGWNENGTDETLVPADNKQRGEIINFLSSADPKHTHFNAMISNGKIGTLITVDGEGLTTDQKKEVSDKSTIDKMNNGRRYQIFVPGLMQEQAQAKINQNTSSRAIQEINSMQDWGYSYKTKDGNKITPDGYGNYITSDKQTITKNDAIRLINKDMIIEDALNNLKYEYLNSSNDIASKESYEQMARLIAVKAGNELFPGIALQDVNGNPYTVNDIFNHKGLIGSYYGDNIDDEAFEYNMNYQVDEKIRNIYDVYDAIMKGVEYYNIDPNFNIKH